MIWECIVMWPYLRSCSWRRTWLSRQPCRRSGNLKPLNCSSLCWEPEVRWKAIPLWGQWTKARAWHRPKPGSTSRQNTRATTEIRSGSSLACTRCGERPTHDRQHCPARDVTCWKSGKRGHYQAVCWSARVSQSQHMYRPLWCISGDPGSYSRQYVVRDNQRERDSNIALHRHWSGGHSDLRGNVE